VYVRTWHGSSHCWTHRPSLSLLSSIHRRHLVIFGDVSENIPAQTVLRLAVDARSLRPHTWRRAQCRRPRGGPLYTSALVWLGVTQAYRQCHLGATPRRWHWTHRWQSTAHRRWPWCLETAGDRRSSGPVSEWVSFVWHIHTWQVFQTIRTKKTL